MHRLINNTTHEVISFQEWNEQHLFTTEDIDFASYGYSIIHDTPMPNYSRIESVSEGAPTFDGTQWNQTWVITDLTQSMSTEEISALAIKMKKAKQDDLMEYRATMEVQDLTINGMTLMGDIASRQTLLNALVLMEANMISDVDWKMATGWVTITTQVVEGLAYVMSNYVKNCFSIERMHDETLAAMTDIHDIVNYDITSGWPPTTYQI